MVYLGSSVLSLDIEAVPPDIWRHAYVKEYVSVFSRITRVDLAVFKYIYRELVQS